ncbi:unnamed protein product [Amoebophrya sp. A25]|nr:unnamed protein product [Amoebophrya sp. A25]|eukprot:GSA25T00021137001.1
MISLQICRVRMMCCTALCVFKEVEQNWKASEFLFSGS